MAEYNGTAGDDVYVGTADQDQIYGEGGDDQLSGGDNYDYIDGGADDDIINGDGDHDTLIGGDGNDIINGGTGFDEIFGDAGNDVLSGGADDDVLRAGAGNDSLSGGEGNDFLRGGSGVDSFDGGADDGVKTFSSASLYGDLVSFLDILATQGVIADLRNGQVANDGFGNAETMVGVESFGAGTAFADQFYGNDGRNAATGGRGDTVMAFAGDDLLSITGAPAVLDGGAGIDGLSLLLSGGLVAGNPGGPAASAPAMTAGYVVDLQAQTLTDGHGFSGTILGIEFITATDLDDVLRGSGSDEWFAPGWGSDTVDGRGGVDTISYATDPYAYYFGFKGGIFVDLASGQVIETITNRQVSPGPNSEGRASPPTGTTGAGADGEFTDSIAAIENVEGTGLGDTIYGDGADNLIAPGAGNDLIDGRGGIDTIDYSPARAGVVVRLDQGNAVESGTGETTLDVGVPDYFNGVIIEAEDYGQSTDQLTGIENAIGTAFDDMLVGDAGANRLEGEGGNDVLTGRAGADSLIGGAGTDTADYSLETGGGGITVNLSADPVFPAIGVVVQPGQARDSHGAIDSLVGIENFKTGSGVDIVHGDAAANRIETGGGDDYITGGAGADTLIGGSGNDQYFIYASDSATFEDSVVELSGEGIDSVRTTLSTFSLAALPEIEYLIGLTNIAFTLTGNDLGNYIQGNGSGDTLVGGLGNDELVGLGGDDTMRGGLGDDIYRVEEVGDVVEENGGEGTDTIWTTLGTYSLLGTQVENLIAFSNIAHNFRGSAANNLLSGADLNDVFLLQDGGEDEAIGSAGNDIFYFGTALSAGDVADGGDGRDAIVFQGNVTAVLNDTNLFDMESISIQSGANAFFGDTANNFYDYAVTTADGNVAAGVQMIVNAQSLRAGEDFTFDGSAESDGRFVVYGGHGVDDLTGGDGADVFFFEGTRWGPDDRVDGGAGRDSLVISAGSGLSHIEFEADSFTGIESISLNNFFASDPSQKPSYELVLHNGNVAPGGNLIVNGSSVGAGQVVNIDGRGIHDGNLLLFGGGGHDVLTGGDGGDLIMGGGGADSLTGGAGADIFRYDSVSDSAGFADLIGDFQSGVDKIDLSRIDADTATAGNQAFVWIGAAAFSNVAGQLRTYEADGYKWIAGDTDGDGVGDLVIALHSGTALVQGDFLP